MRAPSHFWQKFKKGSFFCGSLVDFAEESITATYLALSSPNNNPWSLAEVSPEGAA